MKNRKRSSQYYNLYSGNCTTGPKNMLRSVGVNLSKDLVDNPISLDFELKMRNLWH